MNIIGFVHNMLSLMLGNYTSVQLEYNAFKSVINSLVRRLDLLMAIGRSVLLCA